MKPCLRSPLFLSSLLGPEKSQPGQSNPVSPLLKKTSAREAEELDLDFGQNNNVSICIPDSTFDCISPQGEGVSDHKGAICSQFDYIDGKELDLVKHIYAKNNLENNEVESVSTQDESQNQQNSTFNKKSQILYRSISKLRVKRQQKRKENAKAKRNVRPKKVTEAVFDSELQNVLLKVETRTKNRKEEDLEYLTREELLEEDPKLLLYFYESHLQFKRKPSFQASYS